jgi:hypothetical protein
MTEMVLPQFGMGMADGTIIAWHKSEGERIEQGEPLCDVEAAKTTVEVPAPRGGILQRILVPAGANVPVNTVIALIGDTDLVNEAEISEPLAGEAVNSEVTAAPMPESPPPSVPETAQATSTARVQAHGAPAAPGQPRAPAVGRNGANGQRQIEPRARRAARLRGLDLSSIHGTGPGGRIIESDVLEAALAPVVSDPTPIPVEAAVPGPAGNASLAARTPNLAGTGLRQLRMRCDAGPLLRLLEQLVTMHEAAIPVTAALLKATAKALGQPLLAGGDIGLRSDSGDFAMIDNPAGLSLSNIATQLAAAKRKHGPLPALVMEWHDEDWLSEIVSFDPSVAASLSFCLLADEDGESGDQWSVVLTIWEGGPSLSEARQMLASLRQMLLHPLAIVA